MNLPAFPPGVGIKGYTVEQRVFLSLVTLHQRKQTKSTLRSLAQDLETTYDATLAAVVKLLGDGAANIKPIDANEFEFSFSEKLPRAMMSIAATHKKYTETRASKRKAVVVLGAPVVPREPFVLTPERMAQVDAVMPDAKRLAEKLNEPLLAHKLGGCILRLGLEQIESMVKQAVNTDSQGHPVASCFFMLYRRKKKAIKLAEAKVKIVT